MNERIKELAREAGLLVYNPEGAPTKLEKFAELIVADCIAICISNALGDLDSSDQRGSSAKSAFEIKEHFGVEHGCV